MTPYELYILAVIFIGMILAAIGLVYLHDHIETHLYVNRQLKKMDKHNVPPNPSDR